MTQEDLDGYMAYIQKAKRDYKVAARGTDCNDWELKRLDEMAVEAMALLHNPEREKQ